MGGDRGGGEGGVEDRDFLGSFEGEVVVGLEVVREAEEFGVVGFGSLMIRMVWAERDRRGFCKSSHFWRCRSRAWFLRGFGFG